MPVAQKETTHTDYIIQYYYYKYFFSLPTTGPALVFTLVIPHHFDMYTLGATFDHLVRKWRVFG